jgi:UDP-2-acetamido-3-amino-2,3-dideoxy-glucuronate N-acetyltransferase
VRGRSLSNSNPFVAHESAEIEPGALIGDGTRIWHHAHIRSGAVIGAHCNLGQNVYVDNGAVIGDLCKCQNNVSVYEGVTLEDEVFVGPSAVFTNDMFPRAQNPDWVVVPTRVRKSASIGANATIVCGIELGEYCTVGAGAVVTRSVEPYELVVGNPAHRIGWVCRCGKVVSRSHQKPDDFRCDDCRAAGS